MTTPLGLITEPDADTWLGVSPRTMRTLRSEGKISYVLVRSRVRYTIDDLQRYVEGQRTCQSTPEKVPPSGGCRSRSPGVIDFEEVRA
jgi:hypothetical protein